jgi:hypothetical protein
MPPCLLLLAASTAACRSNRNGVLFSNKRPFRINQSTAASPSRYAWIFSRRALKRCAWWGAWGRVGGWCACSRFWMVREPTPMTLCAVVGSSADVGSKAFGVLTTDGQEDDDVKRCDSSQQAASWNTDPPPPLHLASRSSALQTVALPYTDSAVTVVVCRLLMRAELPLLPPARYRSKHDPLLPPTAR